MKTYLRKIVAFINDEEAAAAIEYALLLVMVALAIIGVAATLGPKIAGVFTAVDTAMRCLLINRPWFFGKKGPKPQGFGPGLTGNTSFAKLGGLNEGKRPEVLGPPDERNLV